MMASAVMSHSFSAVHLAGIADSAPRAPHSLQWYQYEVKAEPVSTLSINIDPSKRLVANQSCEKSTEKVIDSNTAAKKPFIKTNPSACKTKAAGDLEKKKTKATSDMKAKMESGKIQYSCRLCNKFFPSTRCFNAERHVWVAHVRQNYKGLGRTGYEPYQAKHIVTPFVVAKDPNGCEVLDVTTNDSPPIPQLSQLPPFGDPNSIPVSSLPILQNMPHDAPRTRYGPLGRKYRRSSKTSVYSNGRFVPYETQQSDNGEVSSSQESIESNHALNLRREKSMPEPLVRKSSMCSDGSPPPSPERQKSVQKLKSTKKLGDRRHSIQVAPTTQLWQPALSHASYPPISEDGEPLRIQQLSLTSNHYRGMVTSPRNAHTLRRAASALDFRRPYTPDSDLYQQQEHTSHPPLPLRNLERSLSTPSYAQEMADSDVASALMSLRRGRIDHVPSSGDGSPRTPRTTSMYGSSDDIRFSPVRRQSLTMLPTRSASACDFREAEKIAHQRIQYNPATNSFPLQHYTSSQRPLQPTRPTHTIKW